MGVKFIAFFMALSPVQAFALNRARVKCALLNSFLYANGLRWACWKLLHIKHIKFVPVGVCKNKPVISFAKFFGF